MINNKLESDFKIKANYFNSFFASKSTPLVNSSATPNWPQYVSTARLSWFCFNEEFISKIINDLNTNKAHGHMINQCGWSTKLFSKSFLRSCLWFSRTPLILSHFQISWSEWCHNTVTIIWTNNICSLGTSFNKIEHWILINSYRTIFCFYLCAFLEWNSQKGLQFLLTCIIIVGLI